MKTLPPALAAHVAGGLTTLCRCWRVDRRDGVVMGFTDFDRDLVFDAVTFRAASGVLTRGKLVWTSGVNNGLAVEIKAHSSSAGVSRIAIALPMGAPVVVGDTFSATAGCDRTFATCRDRFANTVNFGGFPHMPGTDFAMSYPNQGAGNDGGKFS